MPAQFSLRHPWRLSSVAVTALVTMIASGCGASVSSPTTGASVETDRQAKADVELAKTVVLDWGGGYSEITSEWLAGADLSQLYLPSGESLEDYAESFQEAVRVRVDEILRGIGPARFTVLIDEAEECPDGTVVYFSADAIASDGFQIGQTKLDQCDLREHGTAIVWLGTLLKLGDEHGYDQWVNALANTAAHEVGHTVGFFHPDADGSDFTQYEKNTEIMMAVHTLSALLSPQEFIIPQETCPESIQGEFGGIAYTVSDP